MNIESFINNYKTKYPQGFTNSEIKDIITLFPNMHMDKFINAFVGNTTMTLNNETIVFHCDVIKAIHCGLENRDININEFD